MVTARPRTAEMPADEVDRRFDEALEAARARIANEKETQPVSRSKQKGTKHESDLVAFLHQVGAIHVERRALNGTRDRGDIAGIPGVVIEAKNEKQITLAAYLDEAKAEAANDHADLGVAWIHRRGKASPGDGYVVMDGYAFVWLLTKAGYIKEAS